MSVGCGSEFRIVSQSEMRRSHLKWALQALVHGALLLRCWEVDVGRREEGGGGEEEEGRAKESYLSFKVMGSSEVKQVSSF